MDTAPLFYAMVN